MIKGVENGPVGTVFESFASFVFSPLTNPALLLLIVTNEASHFNSDFETSPDISKFVIPPFPAETVPKLTTFGVLNDAVVLCSAVISNPTLSQHLLKFAVADAIFTVLA
ncbi:hypothetical protein ACQYE5_002943 [Enterobacter cancerogenus]